MHQPLKDLETKPLLQLLSFSIPAIIGMLLTSGIVIVDGLFIGRIIGQEGLAATNFSLPLLQLFMAVTIMVAIGGAVKTSHALGAKEAGKARGIFSLTITMLVAAVLPLALICRLVLGPVLNGLSSHQDLTPWLKPYLGTMILFYPAMMLNITFSIFLRSEGKPMQSLFFGVAGNLINLLLDYLMIARWQMGMRGAALASGLSMLIPLALGLLYFSSKKTTLGFQKLSQEKGMIKEILFNGSSEMIGQLSIAITVAIFNAVILKRLGIEGVAAFTVVGYISFVQVMFITGLSEGLTPILGYSFGAKNWKHIKRVTKRALLLGFAAGLLGWIMTLLFGTSMAGLFSRGNNQVISLAQGGFWLYTLAFLFNGFNFLTSAFFTSMGDPKSSGLIASLRGLILINGLVLVLPRLLGDWGIWLSFPLAEGITMGLAAALIIKRFRDMPEIELGQELDKIRA